MFPWRPPVGRRVESVSMETTIRVWTYEMKVPVQYKQHVAYSETSLIRHSMGPENNIGLGGCWIMECLLPYLSMVTVPHIMVGLERMSNYRGVGLERFHCTCFEY